MTNARQDGFYLLLLGSVFFVAIGTMMEMMNPLGMTDFQQIYYGTRTVFHHHNPYQPDDVAAVYRAETQDLPADTGISHTKRLIIFGGTNLPTTLFLIAPVAVLPWKWAVVTWMALIGICFILACFLVWRLGADSAPRVYGVLILLILVNSGVLLMTGNTAGLVVSLSAIAVFCFLQNRFVPLAVVCLAIALAMKPHDAGPIWLYFVLAGGVQRKRAFLSLALTALIAGVAVLWLSHIAPHWLHEFQSNLQTNMGAGGRDNPGPTTQGGRGFGQIISLQALLGFMWDNTRFSNLADHLICGVLFLIWCVKTWRVGYAQRLAWFALASISALTLLPVYHRTYDARLLLLTIPACAMLWKKGGPIAWCALVLNLAGILLTGDLFWLILFQLTHYSGPSVTLGMIPAPLILFALGIFYLWIYLRKDPAAALDAAAAGL